MFSATFLLVLFFSAIHCDESSPGRGSVEKNKMMGVETVHDVKKENPVKIDKDTIITKNLKLAQKMRSKNAPADSNAKGDDPDWSYEEFPPEVAAHVAAFKRNMTQCLKEVQSDKRSVKRLSPGKESPVHGECLIACVLKRNGVIQKGKVHKENLLNLVGKFYSKNVTMMKKLERNLDRCVEISARAGDDCALAAQLNECTNGLMASNKHKVSVKY